MGTKVTLGDLCSREKLARHDIHMPHVIRDTIGDNWRVATDGCHLVAVRTGDDADDAARSPSCKFIWDEYYAYVSCVALSLNDLLEICSRAGAKLPRLTPCKVCGWKRRKQCSDCNGNGGHHCETCYTYIECDTCFGGGSSDCPDCADDCFYESDSIFRPATIVGATINASRLLACMLALDLPGRTLLNLHKMSDNALFISNDNSIIVIMEAKTDE